VVRAVDTVEAALERFDTPVYVGLSIVHNPHVVRRLIARGAVFLHELDEVAVGVPVVYSAHGVARSVESAATARGLRVIDATCPPVDKVNLEFERFVAEGYAFCRVIHGLADEASDLPPESVHARLAAWRAGISSRGAALARATPEVAAHHEAPAPYPLGRRALDGLRNAKWLDSVEVVTDDEPAICLRRGWT